MKTSFDPVSGSWLSKTTDRLPGHDLYFGTPMNRPWAGIPIGDGDMGSLIWQERDGIHINIGKSDLWRDASPGATPDDECFNGSIEEEQTVQKHGGEIIIRFRHPAFDYMYQKSYHTRLSLADAAMTIDAQTPMGAVSARAFASADAHVSVLHCKVTTEEADAPEIRLLRWGSRSMWRWYWQHTPHPEIGLDGTEAYASDDRLYITQDLGTTKFCLGLALICDASEKHSERRNSHESSITLTAAQSHDMLLYYTIRIADTTDAAKEACAAALEQAIAVGEDALYRQHRADWEAFWNRSHIALSDDYLENTYYLFLYYMNSGNRGAYPMRFIHGPWGFYHDFEPWAYYFHYNMQQLFAPLDAAGHGELAMNYYNMRRNSLDTARLFAQRYKHRQGAFFHDVTDRYGRGAGYDSDNHTPGSQMAMEMWHHYCYTGDEAFLYSHALPMMHASTEYYLDLLEKEADGLYHTHMTCGYEGNYLMDDTITDLAMMRVLFRSYRPYADEALGARIDDALAHMTNYVLAPMEQGKDLDGDVVIAGIGQGRTPVGAAQIYTVGRNSDGSRQRKHLGRGSIDLGGKCLFPFIEFAPLYPSGDLGLKDRGTPEFDAMQNQLYITSDPLVDGGMQWRMTTVFLARMGMGEDLYKTARGMMDIFQAYPNGFNAEQEEPACKPPFHAPQWYRPHNTDNGKRYKLCPDDFTHFSFETVPVTAKALQESLLQSHEGILRLCPATPADHTVSFSLYAEGGYKVTAEAGPDGYTVTLENQRGEDRPVELPAHWSAPYVSRKRGNAPFEPVQAQQTVVGNETLLILPDNRAGDLWLLSSCPPDALETVSPEIAAPNMQMKECGKAHLGTPALMTREDGYYRND